MEFPIRSTAGGVTDSALGSTLISGGSAGSSTTGAAAASSPTGAQAAAAFRQAGYQQGAIQETAFRKPGKPQDGREDAPLSFRAFALAEPLLRGLQASGFSEPTEIQAKALPAVLRGRDVMASAQTGTGKTAAFVLPALQLLLKPSTKPGRGPRVLVLTPTRELAGQVEGVVHELGRYARLKIGSIVGGVSYLPQERLLRSALDLLVATPGRLIDHMAQGLVDFGRLELFVLDEADRMLDMGFIKPVKHIAAALPSARQTLLFSATLEGEVLRVAQQLMRNPVTIQLATATMRHAGISHRVLPATNAEHKHALLARLLEDPAVTQAIVFTATKRGAGKLAKRLAALGHKAAALHGNMRQSARNRTVALLRSGAVRLIVATDVAARGIDVEGISHVINFNLPAVAEDYIHRTGRTGRNGATGIALSLVDAEDRARLATIEKLLGRRLEQVAGKAVPPLAGAGAQPRRETTGQGRLQTASRPPAPGQPRHGTGAQAGHGDGERGRHQSGSQPPARGHLVRTAAEQARRDADALARRDTKGQGRPQAGNMQPAPVRPAPLPRPLSASGEGRKPAQQTSDPSGRPRMQSGTLVRAAPKRPSHPPRVSGRRVAGNGSGRA